uniref:50S ribosomal protein L6 n=1 Tax=Nephromyces sp. ex Molgula occidentalis TaxID=2544991 RepID=A0A5C1HAQ2_9APIC|nr:50S ribosomal protein L6 [Nephromyces sp. ex Molgula occidentalis]
MNLKLYKQELNNKYLFNIIDKKTKLNILLIKKNNLNFKIYLLNNMFFNLGFNYYILLKKILKSFSNLYINLIKKFINMDIYNYKKELIIKGLGFYFNKNIKTKILQLNIGKTHLINIKLPLKIQIKIINNGTNLILKGININLLNLVSSSIKMLKIPEIYKEKGIYYVDEKNKIQKKYINNKKF